MNVLFEPSSDWCSLNTAECDPSGERAVCWISLERNESGEVVVAWLLQSMQIDCSVLRTDLVLIDFELNSSWTAASQVGERRDQSAMIR